MSDPRFQKPGLDQAVYQAVEEMGELLSALGKSKRHGWLSVNPLLPRHAQETNIAWVWREIADVREALDRLERDLLARLRADGEG